jgi:hypothetical protein
MLLCTRRRVWSGSDGLGNVKLVGSYGDWNGGPGSPRGLYDDDIDGQH